MPIRCARIPSHLGINNIILVIGFCSALREVEYNSVIHISLQFWNEPWPYGMDDENTDIRQDEISIID